MVNFGDDSYTNDGGSGTGSDDGSSLVKLCIHACSLIMKSRDSREEAGGFRMAVRAVVGGRSEKADDASVLMMLIMIMMWPPLLPGHLGQSKFQSSVDGYLRNPMG